MICCNQAAPGWEPKPFLRGHEDRIFLLDFFGAPTPMKNGIKVGLSLTARAEAASEGSHVQDVRHQEVVIGIDNDLPYQESAQQ